MLVVELASDLPQDMYGDRHGRQRVHTFSYMRTWSVWIKRRSRHRASDNDSGANWCSRCAIGLSGWSSLGREIRIKKVAS